MDLDFTEEEKAFRQEVRLFLENNYPEHLKNKVSMGVALKKEDYVLWQKILYEKGWIAPDWPIEYGGTGWTAIEKYIFEEECGAASCPRLTSFGLYMIAPVLLKYGTEEQKKKYLPGILSSDTWWSQGYSEPNAGSDLASLQTRAENKGSYYLVNGTKTWTTHAHYSDMMFALVRTSKEEKKQKGISFILIDMTSPGVSIEPIITIDGLHVVNQVFLDDVKVPVENLVGSEGDGWTIAKYLLQHERTNIAQVPRSKKQLERLKSLASNEIHNGKPLLEDPLFRAKVTAVEVELMGLEMTSLRVLSKASAGETAAMTSSFLKVKGTEVQQKLTALLMEAVGYFSFPYFKGVLMEGWQDEQSVGAEEAAFLASHYFDWRKTSIYGGSNEIQKNIIAKVMLGL